MKRRTASGAVSLNGITITDQGDYFRVVWEDGAVETFTKSHGGFESAGELLAWLTRPD